MRRLALGLLFVVCPTLPMWAFDLNAAVQAMQAAEKAGDPAQIKRSAADVYAGVHEVLAAPEPSGAEEQTARKTSVDYAEYAQSYTDFVVYSAALKTTPANAVDLLSTLDQHSPKSKYLDGGGYALYFQSLEKTGGTARIVGIAEKAVARFPSNPDLLLVLCDNAMAHKQKDATIQYGKRLAAAASARAKSEGEARTKSFLARGYWAAGVTEAQKNEFAAADKDLRAALPLLQGNDETTGAALFYLGVANYQLGRTIQNRSQVVEAQKFSERAAALKGSYSNQASTNAQVIKAELAKWR